MNTTTEITLSQQQEKVCNQLLDWLKTEDYSPRTLVGYAGVGKTFLLKYAITAAKNNGLINNVLACAPTHKAKKVIAKSMLGVANEFKTVQSAFKIRPSSVIFTEVDEARLEMLLDMSEKSLEDKVQINYLTQKQDDALHKRQNFVSNGELTHLEAFDLIIIDESSMLNAYIVGLITNACATYPTLRILFVGDKAQLPPIKETESISFKFENFNELTDVMRYDGEILRYCNAVRTDPGYERIHNLFSDYDDIFKMRQAEILIPSVLNDCFLSGETCRIVTSTNDRVLELNTLVRTVIKGDRVLSYESGDELITNGSVIRYYDGYKPYKIGCGNSRNGDSLLLSSSEDITLTQIINTNDMMILGENIGKIQLTDEMMSFVAFDGTKLKRQFWRFESYDENGNLVESPYAIILLDPNQVDIWKTLVVTALDRAKTTISNSKEKSKRGQAGDKAKSVWAELNIKNWNKKLDGSEITGVEFGKIKSRLWNDYYSLIGFHDPITFSYCSTVHRLQGCTVDCVILDIDKITERKPYQKTEDTSWDIRKMLYTSASRASKQVVFMSNK